MTLLVLLVLILVVLFLLLELLVMELLALVLLVLLPQTVQQTWTPGGCSAVFFKCRKRVIARIIQT